jgi:hypothetical protein
MAILSAKTGEFKMVKNSATMMLVQVLLLVISFMSSILAKNVEYMSGMWVFSVFMVIGSVMGFMALLWLHESVEGEMN